jgi:hypothetical protein
MSQTGNLGKRLPRLLTARYVYSIHEIWCGKGNVSFPVDILRDTPVESVVSIDDSSSIIITTQKEKSATNMEHLIVKLSLIRGPYIRRLCQNGTSYCQRYSQSLIRGPHIWRLRRCKRQAYSDLFHHLSCNVTSGLAPYIGSPDQRSLTIRCSILVYYATRNFHADVLYLLL